MMAARGVVLFTPKPSLILARQCRHHGSPLSPRQRYVRLQSDQADKSKFANKREFSISPGEAGPNGDCHPVKEEGKAQLFLEKEKP
jgi:hypothetical protein